MNKKQQGTFAILGATLAVAGAIAAGINFNNNSESNLQTSTPGYSLQTEAIESSSASKVQSSTVPIAKGNTKVTTQGINGLEEITYSVTYVDGEETDPPQLSVMMEHIAIVSIAAALALSTMVYGHGLRTYLTNISNLR